jgi:DNA polymerase III gamma/tau subunit
VESQGWNEQLHAEFAEVLEKVHVLFRTAKRHDMLGSLTATRRADAAEALSACEQVFRVLLDQEYLKARRILELHSDLLADEKSTEEKSDENGNLPASLSMQAEQKQVTGVGDEPGLPELPI